MKLSPWYLAILTPLAMIGSGAFLGHVVVLAVTFGIFFGTLSIGRAPSPTGATRLEPPTLPG